MDDRTPRPAWVRTLGRVALGIAVVFVLPLLIGYVSSRIFEFDMRANIGVYFFCIAWLLVGARIMRGKWR